MRRKPPTKHSPEEVKQALARLQTGEALADVAKHFGVNKSLLVYWRDRAGQLDARQPRTQAAGKGNERTRKFIERCWGSITLAFKKLDGELKKEKPQGIRDLALAIAVLRDKLSQATQSLNAQSAPAASGFTASEDTLMILRRHRETQVAAPHGKIVAEPSLAGTSPEPQKDDTGATSIPAEVVLVEPEQVQPRRDGAR